MGYCGYAHCSDPNCIGRPESGPFPAEIHILSLKGYKKIHVYPGEYRRMGAPFVEQSKIKKGLEKLVKNSNGK